MKHLFLIKLSSVIYSQAHKAKCEYVLVACSHDGCPTRIQQKEDLLKSHKERCDYRPTKCLYCVKNIVCFTK